MESGYKLNYDNYDNTNICKKEDKKMMTVQLNVDETQFKDILDKELNEMPKELIQEAILSAIKEYFLVNNGKNLNMLIEKQGYYSGERSPSEFLVKIFKGCDYSKIQEVIDKMIDRLKTDYDNILRKVLIDALVGGFANTYSMNEAIRSEIYHTMAQMNNNNN